MRKSTHKASFQSGVSTELRPCPRQIAAGVLCAVIALAGIVYGEWLETRTNTLLEGWNMLGGGKGRPAEWRLSLGDVFFYAPFLSAIAGVTLHCTKRQKKFLSVIIYLGGATGALGMLSYPVFAPYGMRLGILPFLVALALLWRWRQRIQHPCESDSQIEDPEGT